MSENAIIDANEDQRPVLYYGDNLKPPYRPLNIYMLYVYKNTKITKRI